MSDNSDTLLDAQDVASMLRVSRNWVYDHTPRKGKPARKRPALPALRMDGVIRYRRSAVIGWLEQQEAAR